MANTQLLPYTQKSADAAVLRHIPRMDDHVTFDTLVRRLRQVVDWKLSQRDAEVLVHDSVKRLENSGRVVCQTHPNMPLYYSQPLGPEEKA